MNGYLMALSALLVAACAWIWNLYSAADARAVRAEETAASLDATLQMERANAKLAVKQIVVEKEVIRRVPRIVRQLVSVCDDSAAMRPDSAATSGAAGAEAGDVRAGWLRSLGPEIASCLSESERLMTVREAAKNAGCAP